MSFDSDLKSKVAREAAVLLYFGAEKEYKQAKVKAAETFGVHFLPSNFDVALELDKIAQEYEGASRKERLIKMRLEALTIMKLLDAYHPLLIGSVWRGTIRQSSDIDIAAYSDNPDEIVKLLKANGLKITKTDWTTVNKHGKTLSSFHIHTQTTTKIPVEIVIRSQEEAGQKRKCQVFGDVIKGLKIQELEKLLKENPTKRFIPP